ncbi:lipopolysaccharide biosynthesis protein [Haloarchaeobius amylolyticus]|uniref:lipopolysaccharide biosynthesis protein n=1 Tax=Haloarchaeobius amylolyticus TaxID=1198296 RepID=UPI00226DAC52|nr:lipopolysaccharide biosynthesis protein [Haloarchaeobius amylolyticus]
MAPASDGPAASADGEEAPGAEAPAGSDPDGMVSDSEDAVDARLADALERVAHGATVSIPSILLERGLTVAFTAVLTNGFSANAYGLFALARRLQRFLLHVALGFRSGLSRFLPNADSEAERDTLVTFAGVLLLAVASVFGVGLYLAAPVIAEMTGRGGDFRGLLRLFAIGLPAAVFLFTVGEALRGLEEVVPLNLTLRIGYPLAQLLVAVVGVVVFDDLALVAAGVLASMALTGVVAMGWLVRERGLGFRLRSPGEEVLWRKYIDYTLPLFVGGIATTIQRLGFYPLIVVFLSNVAGGVFAIGVLLGSLVRLPLMGINQFIPPVAAALNEEGHRESLSRLYHVTSRLVLVAVTGLSVPVIVYRDSVLALFGPTYVQYAPLLPWFVLAQYGACAAGSVGILLAMTDNQRALLVVNVFITALLTVTAIPLTSIYGLEGLVASYFLMLTINNGLEVAVLYRLEGLQPFTRLHAKPLVAAVPFVAVTVGAGMMLPRPAGPLLGTALGLAVYGVVLWRLGFTPVEHRLAETLAARYRLRSD